MRRTLNVAELDLVCALALWTSTGKATLRRRCFSCQSTSVSKSILGTSSYMYMRWTTDERPNRRLSSTPARTGPSSMTVIDSRPSISHMRSW